MKQRDIECFFDLGSTSSYLAWTQLPRIARDTGATLTWRPMLLGGVFKSTGNTSPAAIPAKGRWILDDTARWAARYGVPFVFNPYFPINTITLMRSAVGIQMHRPKDFDGFIKAAFQAIWVERKNVVDPAVLATVLAEAGLDPDALLSVASEPEVKAALVSNTAEAVSRGVFGAPTIFVGDAMFFGQDRLDFVREELLA